jgi:LysM repeat protein
MYYNFHAAKVNLYRALAICFSLTLVAAFLSERTESVSAGNKRIVAASETTTTTISTPLETVLVAEAATTQPAQVIVQTTVLPTTTTTVVIPNPCKYDNTNRYTIQSGDALYSIADKYNTAIYDIVGCNQWQESLDHLILPGDIIYLPPDAHLTVVTTTTVAPPTTSKPTPVATTPATSPAPPVAPVSGRRTHPGCWWEPVIRQAFANAGASVNVQDFFVFVAWRESRCEQTAYNPNRSTGDDSYGLFQLNMLPQALGPLMTSWGYTGSMLLNGNTNIQATVRLWQRMGQCPWNKPNYCS